MDDTTRVTSVVENYIFRVPTMVYVEVQSTNQIAAKLKMGGTQTKELGEAITYREYEKAELIGVLPADK